MHYAGVENLNYVRWFRLSIIEAKNKVVFNQLGNINCWQYIFVETGVFGFCMK